MKLYCEVVAKEILPSLRALIAKTLIEKHKLTQIEAAKRLELTQGAISQYYRYLRGVKTKQLEKDEAIIKKIEEFAAKLASDVSHKEAVEGFYDLCKLAIKKIGGENSHSEDCKICFS
jgi:predicted transcriptional regulator